MNDVVLLGFVDELTKIAGVGWDLHGYSVTPAQLAKQQAQARMESEEYDRKMQEALGEPVKPQVTDTPGFFGKLLGRSAKSKPNPAYEAYRQKQLEYMKSNKPPQNDSWEAARAARIKTPYDQKTNYKLNMTLGAGNPAFDEWTTDEAYSDKPVVRNLGKKELKKVIEAYQQAASKYKMSPGEEAYVPEGQQAFISKAQHLLADPNMRFARLEYE